VMKVEPERGNGGTRRTEGALGRLERDARSGGAVGERMQAELTSGGLTDKG